MVSVPHERVITSHACPEHEENQGPEFESSPEIIIPDPVIFPELLHLRQFAALYEALFFPIIRVFQSQIEM
jgi:hypothetical protein